MKYDIFYRPVFTKKARTLSGYEMVVYPHDPARPHEDFDVMTIEPKAHNEFTRFENMLSSVYDPFSSIAFVDKHPLEILRHVRGEEPPETKRTTEWQKEVENWSVDVRGDRV